MFAATLPSPGRRCSSWRHLLRWLDCTQDVGYALCQSRAFAADEQAGPSRGGGLQRRDKSDRYMSDPRGGPPPGADLAMLNAPKKLLELVGDPRTGVADDTTRNPFGEMTADMIHHQLTNEVYWFKYEFHGHEAKGTHRDSRLSDYSKNLIYLLRASDPERWSIDALAEKFRIRKQRVLAILALKEMESQAISKGEMLTGPMSAYGVKVRLSDLRLEGSDEDGGRRRQRTGRPLPTDEAAASAADDNAAAASAAAGQTAESAVAAGSLPALLPLIMDQAHALQLQLLRFLAPYDYDAATLKTALLADLAAAEAYYNEHLAAKPGAAGSGAADATAAAAAPSAAKPEGGGDSPAAGSAAAGGGALLPFDFAAARAQIEQVVAALQPLLQSPSLARERQVVALAKQLGPELDKAAAHTEVQALLQPGAADAAAATGSVPQFKEEALQLLQLSVQEALAPLTASEQGLSVLVAVMRLLGPAQRRALQVLDPKAVIALKALGVDIHDLASSSSCQADAPSTRAAASASATDAGSNSSSSDRRSDELAMLLDLFDFQPIAPAALNALADGMAALEGTAAATAQQLAPLGAVTPLLGSAGFTAADLRGAVKLMQAYTHVDAMVAKQQGAQIALTEAAAAQAAAGPGRRPQRGDRQQQPGLSLSERQAMLKIIHEVDPELVKSAAFYDSVQAAEASQRGRRGGGSKRGSFAAVAAAAGPEDEALESDADRMRQAAVAQEQARSGVAAVAEDDPMRHAKRVDWDLLAAWLDVHAVKRLFHRGSGERHRVRLATAPAFQGASLAQFNQMMATQAEGEYSRLNRLAAEKEEAALYERFSTDLLYNLGALAPQNWDPCQPPIPRNLAAEARSHNLVVYPISDAGETGAPAFVAQPDGAKRELNEAELAYQARRKPVQLARYQFKQFKLMEQWGDE